MYEGGGGGYMRGHTLTFPCARGRGVQGDNVPTASVESGSHGGLLCGDEGAWAGPTTPITRAEVCVPPPPPLV